MIFMVTTTNQLLFLYVCTYTLYRNINADAAVMPSLGNQYFAFGGSLPELSLTSLTRLLPNSSASDPSISSCPGLFTLPLYVYPSQQHLATPFINTHGSITFGSFLSSGSSLCSTSKGPLGGSAGSNVSASGDATAHPSSTDTSQSANNDNNNSSEDKVDGCGQMGGGSTPSLQESVIKLPMYSPLSGTLLSGGGGSGEATATASGGGVPSLPAFSTLTRGLESNSMEVSSPMSSSHSNLPVNTASNLTSSALFQNQPFIIAETNALQLHPQSMTSLGDHAPHPVPDPRQLHLPSHPHIRSSSTTPDRSSDKHLPGPHTPLSPLHSELYMTGDSNALPTMPITTRIKMEATDMDTLDMSPAHGGLPILSPEGVQIHSPHGNVDFAPVGAKGVKKERDKPYKCDHPGCGRSFSFPAHLRSHIQQIHISYRPCKCEFPGCGKRFYTPQHLNVHRRVHTGERPFICPYAECSKAFTTAGNLKNHIRTHTGERPYACKFEGCSKRFAEMSSLKKHELTHTGEKPYKCRVCGKAFSQAGSRNTHERKHSRTDEEGGDEDSMGPGGRIVGVTSKNPRKYRIKRISANGSMEDLEPVQQ